MHVGAPAHVGGLPAQRVQLPVPQLYHLPSWAWKNDAKRVAALRQIVADYGRDPRVAALTIQILRASGAEPRDYKAQAAALLKWVQDNVYYANEPGERLQSPEYTLRVGHGDCDDLAILLASMYETIRLPWKFVLSGATRAGKTVRWIEGESVPRGVTWAHIYVCVGRPAFTPKLWAFAEPTLKGAPLGWDVVHAHQRGQRVPVPELGETLVEDSAHPESFADQLSLLRAELVEELQWRRLVIGTVVGAITTLSAGFLVTKLQDAWAKRKQR